MCKREQETINHLFFKCEFSKWVLKESKEATGALVKKEVVASFDGAAREINKITLGSPAWGLQ